MNNRIWKNVKNFENLYEISNDGILKSKSRLILAKNGFYRQTKEKFLKPETDREGYIIYSLSNNGITKKYKAHRLVAESHLTNLENNDIVHHKNGVKNDNRVDNLEWCSHSDNMFYKWLNKSKQLSVQKQDFQKKHRLTKLNEEDVINIRNAYTSRLLNQPQLAEKFNISNSIISEIINRKRWKHVL